MSGNRLVYGDGWDDIKDCVGQSFGGIFRGQGSTSNYGRERSCTKTQLVIALLALWLFILTIVCIVLGSSISYSSGAILSERLEAYQADHDTKHSTHSQLISDLSSNHAHLRGRVKGVTEQLSRLDQDVDHMEGRLKSDVKNKLVMIRETLMNALSKVGQSIQEIKKEVEESMAN